MDQFVRIHAPTRMPASSAGDSWRAEGLGRGSLLLHRKQRSVYTSVVVVPYSYAAGDASQFFLLVAVLRFRHMRMPGDLLKVWKSKRPHSTVNYCGLCLKRGSSSIPNYFRVACNRSVSVQAVFDCGYQPRTSVDQPTLTYIYMPP